MMGSAGNSLMTGKVVSLYEGVLDAQVSTQAAWRSIGIVFFFFQAEDGIRDYKVTGVQTCALPISEIAYAEALRRGAVQAQLLEELDRGTGGEPDGALAEKLITERLSPISSARARS